jgi:hypothetical protein
MNPNNKISVSDIINKLGKDDVLKKVLYISAGFIIISQLGRILASLTSTIRAFNELKNAINGRD